MNTLILSDDHVFIEGIKVNITKLLPKSLFIVLEKDIFKPEINLKNIHIVVTDTRHRLFRKNENIIKLKEFYSHSNHIIFCGNIFSDTFYNFYSQGFSCYLISPIHPSHFMSAIEELKKGLKYIHPKISDALSNDLLLKMSRSASKYSIYTMTSLEEKIMQCIVKEQPNKVISDELGISTKSLEYHKTNIYKKTNSRTPIGVLKYLLRNNIVNLNDINVE